MKGSVFFQNDRGRWAVSWPRQGRRGSHAITRYKGEFMYDRRIAEKCLHMIQSDWENFRAGLAAFRIEKYTGKGWTDVVEFYEQWLDEVVVPTRKPATVKGYRSYLNNWIRPFFDKHPVMLHEIQLDTLCSLLNSIALSGKGKLNVMMAFHTMLDHAWRSRRIPEIPPFPKRAAYGMVKPVIEWISRERFNQVMAAIPPNHQAPFLWMYLHLMRPAEACALMWADWDEINRQFMVRRSLSARQVVNSTKTGEIYPTPCHSAFYPFMQELTSTRRQDSPFIFINSRARNSDRRYTNESLNTIWKAACREVGIEIALYSGVRHSRASQMINELKMSIHEVKEAGTWKRLDSVSRYAKTGLTRKRELLERGDVISMMHYKSTTKEK